MKQFWTEILCDNCNSTIDYISDVLTNKQVKSWVSDYKDRDKCILEGNKIFCCKECYDKYSKKD